MITFTKDLHIIISKGSVALSEAWMVPALGGSSVFNNKAPQLVDIGDGYASGEFALSNGGLLRLKITARELGSPDAHSIKWTLSNAGQTIVNLDNLDAPVLSLNRSAFPPHESIWTMQGAAVHWGQDFAFELPPGFARDNYLGHLQNGEGGGIPVVYFWNKSHGISLMHTETTPKDWFMPVRSSKEGITAALELRQPITLKPGDSFTSLETVISVHAGDFFSPLALYRELITEKGLKSPDPVPANYEPAWCSWGYEFDVTPDEMVGVLPVLDELGIHWLTLDDRWFDTYGDWNPRMDTFPGGADVMRRMNQKIHAAGGFSQIWWYPLCVEDGHGKWESHSYGYAKIYKDHPDWLVLNVDGSVARNNRHLAMLCPALPEVQEYTLGLTRRFILDWEFDGHKLDNIYTMPPCHNPAHHHIRPEESTEAFSEVYRIILEATRQLRPDSVTQICPCGTPLTYSLLPCTDQTVTADPTSSRQIRQRIKFYKALAGPSAAVFADHVELSDNGDDFASEIGTGGIPSTKFIWPGDEKVRARLKEIWDLPTKKKAEWKEWFTIYNEYRLADGEYLNLYDIHFDIPETHAIRKGKNLFYAFFAAHFQGKVELRGLGKDSYRIVDYVHGKELAKVKGPYGWLNVDFKQSLLVMAIPE